MKSKPLALDYQCRLSMRVEVQPAMPPKGTAHNWPGLVGFSLVKHSDLREILGKQML